MNLVVVPPDFVGARGILAAGDPAQVDGQFHGCVVFVIAVCILEGRGGIAVSSDGKVAFAGRGEIAVAQCLQIDDQHRCVAAPPGVASVYEIVVDDIVVRVSVVDAHIEAAGGDSVGLLFCMILGALGNCDKK